MRRIISCLIISALLLCGCSAGKENPGKNTTAEKYSSGNPSLSMRTPTTLDPLMMVQKSNIQAFQLIYDSLVYIDKELRPVPYLAESCSMSVDGKSLDFSLKSGITWHDGKPFSAHDVKYTFDRIMSADDSCIYKSRLQSVESVVVTDNNHFTIKLKYPYVQILNLLDFPIVPKHHKDIDTHPIGTGQYKFVKYIQKNAVVLTRNDEWTIDTLPKIKDLDIKILDKDSDVVSVVRLGEVSAVETDFTKTGDFGTSNKIKTAKYPTTKFEFLGFNCENPALSSAKVRRAISLCINRADIIDDVYFGYGRACNAPIPPDSWMYTDEGKLHNVETAAEILKEDGWKDADGDGFLEKVIDVAPTPSDDDSIADTEDGESTDTVKMNYKLSFSILINSDNNFRQQTFDKIAKSLKEVGIRVTSVKTSWEDYTKNINDGEYDMFLGGYDLSANLDFAFMLKSTSDTNYFGYSSPTMDEALDGLYTPSSDNEIIAAYKAFQNVFTSEAPVAGLCFTDNVMIYSTKLQNVSIPSYSKIYRNINMWQYKK